MKTERNMRPGKTTITHAKSGSHMVAKANRMTTAKHPRSTTGSAMLPPATKGWSAKAK